MSTEHINEDTNLHIKDFNAALEAGIEAFWDNVTKKYKAKGTTGKEKPAAKIKFKRDAKDALINWLDINLDDLVESEIINEAIKSFEEFTKGDE